MSTNQELREQYVETILTFTTASEQDLYHVPLKTLEHYANLVVEKTIGKIQERTSKKLDTLSPKALLSLQVAFPDEITVAVTEEITRSWIAFSATNIPFQNGELILGVRSNLEPRGIPEGGDLALWGGFYFGIKSGFKMFAEIANAHFKNQASIDLQENQCSPFLHCEYNMYEITEPLNTPFGPVHIKRVAFDRIVHLNNDQEIICNPSGKIKTFQRYNQQEWLTLLEKEHENISFPFQAGHITRAFEKGFNLALPKSVDFIA